MKKAIPVIVAVFLILIIGGIYGGIVLKEKLAYSQERMDLREYYGLTDENEVAVILGDETADFKALYIDGTCYFDMDDVSTYFNDRFYVDEHEGLLEYVEPLVITYVTIGETGLTRSDGTSEATAYVPARFVGDRLYLACDYVKRFTDYEYRFYEDPYRMQVYVEWEPRDIAYIKKDTAIRYRGGVKSEILTEVSEGDKVYILDPMEEWTGVKTADGIIGYVENKRLDRYGTEEPIPVTDYGNPDFSSVHLDEKVNLTWHSIAGPAGNDTLSSYLANTHDINVIAPTWYALSDDEGNYRSFASADYVQSAHERGLQVWGVFDNFNDAQVSTYEVMSYTSKRRRLIDSLMADAAAVGLDGINLDFELVPSDAVPHYVEFIRELSVECRKAGIVLSVDNYPPQGGSNYNLKEQGLCVDYVIIMGYDEHYAGSDEAGSVSSIGYVTQGIEGVSKYVDPSKIINGIPFYTRIWETNGADLDSQAVDMATAAQYVSDHGINLTWDDTACQNYGEYTSGGSVHQVWIEDAESIKVKLSVMDTHGVAGVASWRLGMETPDIWDVIAEYLHN